MKYRELGLKARLDAGMTDRECYELLATDGMLVKRPLLVGDDFAIPGFRESCLGRGVAVAAAESATRNSLPEWDALSQSGRLRKARPILSFDCGTRFPVEGSTGK